MIDQSRMYRYSRHLSRLMMEDPNNRGDGYLIRSLYFDTLDDRDYQEKEDGIEVRRKIRLRNYGAGSDFAMLEMKQKQGPLQKKRSVRLRREDALRLIAGDYGALLAYEEPFAQECFAYMQMYCYQPRAVVEYRRLAFIARENKIRVTFDHHLVGTEANYNIFDEKLLQNPILDPVQVILEVKYNGFLLSYIKDMMQECDTSELAVSKYCLGRSVTKHYRF